jgi:hypothetical protein
MEILTRTDETNLDQEILLEDFTAHNVTVPKGFASDGASAPRLFWGIVPPFKRTKKASFVHDWLCRTAKNKEDRLKADRLFFTMLGEAKLNIVRCVIGYLGVRIGAFLGIGVHY